MTCRASGLEFRQQAAGKRGLAGWLPPVSRTVPALALLLLLGISGCRGSSPPAPSKDAGLSPARQHYENGLRLAKAGNDAAARTEWDTAIGLEPGFDLPYLAIASQAEKSGDFKGAVVRLSALRAANPGAAHVECRQAGLYSKVGQIEKAFTAAKEAVRREPDCPIAHYVLGTTLDAAGNTRGAIEELKAAHRLNPESEAISLRLAQAQAQAGRASEAFSLMDPLLQRPSVSAQANYVMGWLLAEYGRDEKRDPAAARVYLKKALAATPDLPYANAELGILLARENQPAAAKPLLERAAGSGLYTPALADAIAAVYSALKDPRANDVQRQATSRKAFEESLRHARSRYLAAPDDIPNTLTLARLEGQRGDMPDARDLVTEVLKKDPNHPQALQLLHSLTESK